MLDVKYYAPFTKVDADERIVSGYASTEALDSQNEIVTRKALEGALPGWLKFGNIREMHQPSAVGVAVTAQMDEKGLLLEAHVVDDSAWKKVKKGVYKGFSIGGHVTSRDPTNKTIITGLDLSEISIVDRPANPEALFAVWKADGVEVPQVIAAQGEAVSKGMYDVRRLADILTLIQGATQDAEWEEKFERDNSTMPDQLKAWLKEGGQLLVQMAAEETAEMTEDETATVEVIALADAAADLAKGGKRNSKADQSKLNDAHAAIVAAGAECGATKSDNTADLTKAADELANVNGDLAKVNDNLAKARDDLAKAHSDLAEAQSALSSMATARDEAVSSLDALTKAQQSTATERDEIAKRNETLVTEKAALATENAAIKTELETLKSIPEPMKGKVVAVAKGDDVSDTSKAGDAASANTAPAETWFSTRPPVAVRP